MAVDHSSAGGLWEVPARAWPVLLVPGFGIASSVSGLAGGASLLFVVLAVMLGAVALVVAQEAVFALGGFADPETEGKQGLPSPHGRGMLAVAAVTLPPVAMREAVPPWAVLLLAGCLSVVLGALLGARRRSAKDGAYGALLVLSGFLILGAASLEAL
ncbi:hypothetical protein [Nocardioides jishulii]|uniref:Uncharacterized protein n=1 Tax=Nocardioides jishulii TaxID=2575440 RepID=A0A4U2YRT0_9ACTN|nr:hypothetical protein [Nocardioides jishulii]QCX28970.1 hypothetical protein FCL41_16675 [Nocardioides jishulii]TKI64129.1 hypothetical protein FC770_02890 [Nocardioides jishulii]